jgi:phosphate transport system substrate-binding protein
MAIQRGEVKQSMKKNMFIVGLLAVACFGPALQAEGKLYRIGMFILYESAKYEDATVGFEKELEQSGLSYTLDIRRGYGDEVRARKLLREFKDSKIDIIVTVGTPGTLLAMEEVGDIPIVFFSVTDPVLSGIAKNLASSGRNVTGTSIWVKPEDRLGVFKECVPNLKTLGVIYDPANSVPVSEVDAARAVAGSLGVALKEAKVTDAGQITKAVSDLLGHGIEALWIPADHLIYTNMAKVAEVTRPRKIPVLASSVEGIGSPGNGGAILAVMGDTGYSGRLAVPAVVDILRGSGDPKNIPIQRVSSYTVIVDTAAAKDIGYKIPLLVIAKASRVQRGSGQKIVVGGTGDSQELLRAAAEAFKEKSGGEVDVPNSIGSSGGIKALGRGEIDLARVARPLKKGEESLGLTCRVFANAPIVFAFHPDVTGIDNITTEQIVGIYSGKITKWSELGAPAGRIFPIMREPGDASLGVLKENLKDFSNIAEPAGKVFYTTQDAVEGIEEYAGTIGFVSLPVVKDTKLKVLKVDGVYPSVENVRNGKYKLVLPLGVVYKQEPQGLAKQFIDFLFSKEGQAVLTKMGVAPAK